MLTTPHRESAQIIAFPAGGRRGFLRQAQIGSDAKVSDNICVEALDTCWYHSDAIRTATPSTMDPWRQ
ncbi:DUF2735 domain-containing protein [Rhizobium sp. SG2393]|uniref:DUF2735 domain-containing protein n=1 Tax=Rhizobium sp. SG2393 TaxID=3276279 RepID=UPI0036714DFF